MKKLLTLVLIASMLLSMFAVGASAAEVEAWDGTAVSEKLEGDGSIENPYLVASGADLRCLSAMMVAGDNFVGKYIKQTADIDLGGKNFSAIGSKENLFCGIYDGNGYKITNFYQTIDVGMTGFFATIKSTADAQAAIINVNLQGAMVTGSYNGSLFGGALVGCDYSVNDTSALIANCTVDVDITYNTTAQSYIGGIIGRPSNNTIIDTNSYGDITVSTDANVQMEVGGIAGRTNTICVIDNCANYGNITVNALSSAKYVYAAGIVALTSTAGNTISNCKNFGEITVNSIATAGSNFAIAGGITGWTRQKTNISNCINNGIITANATHDTLVAGIAAWIQNGEVNVTNCVNNGDINAISQTEDGKATAGGIVSKLAKTNAVDHCINNGLIKASNIGIAMAAGIVASPDSGTTTISNCANLAVTHASITTASNKYPYSGGIVAATWSSTPILITNCYNGAIPTTASANNGNGAPAGIVCNFNTSTAESLLKDCITIPVLKADGTTVQNPAGYAPKATQENNVKDAELSVVEAKVAELKAVIDAAAGADLEKVTINGTDFELKDEPDAPVVPEQPEQPEQPENPDSGDSAWIYIVVAVVAIMGTAVVSKKRSLN